MNSKQNEQIDEIAEDLDEIGEDTDTIIKRIDSNIKLQNKMLTQQIEMIKQVRAAKLGIIAVILLWLVDKIFVWGIIKFT